MAPHISDNELRISKPPTGIPSAAQNLLPEQLSQVDFIARQIHRRLPRHVLLEDLVNAGVIGLIDAIHKFDRDKHVQFGSYAKFRIRGAILDSLREMDWGSRALRRQARRIAQAQDHLATTLGRTPDQAELAERLGVTVEQLQDLLLEIHSLEIASMSSVRCLQDEGSDRSQEFPGPPEETPYFKCLNSEIRELLERTMAQLPENERQVIFLYYFRELTMQEIGSRMGLSESRVSQIHSAAIDRIRMYLPELGSNSRKQQEPAEERSPKNGECPAFTASGALPFLGR
jgi:RNA polymerase sigma factor FliA